jgi:hypothetical protein
MNSIDRVSRVVVASCLMTLACTPQPAAQAEPVTAQPIASLPRKDDNQLEITLAAVEQGGDTLIRVLLYGNEDSQGLQRTSKGGCG